MEQSQKTVNEDHGANTVVGMPVEGALSKVSAERNYEGWGKIRSTETDKIHYTARTKRHDSGRVKEIILANKNARVVQIQVKEKGCSGRISSATLSRRDSLSLTSSQDLYKYVEVRGGRLNRPIFFHGLHDSNCSTP
jgi:hypothetical protein